MSLIDDQELYSDYIASLGSHRKIRPLEPIEVALLTKRLMSELSTADISTIARRTPVKEDQLREFLKLLKLPEKVHGIIGWGQVNDNKLPFSSGAIISELDSEDDMEILCKFAREKKIKKNEVQRIVRLKKHEKNKTLDDCISQVLNLRPTVIKGFMIIGKLLPESLRRLNELQNNFQGNIDTLIRNLISRVVYEGNILNVSLKNDYIFLTVDKRAYDVITDLKQLNDLRIRDLTDYLVCKGMEKND